MALLIAMLLALAVQAQPADCMPVPVGPPMDIQIDIDLTSRARHPIPGVIVNLPGLTQIPSYGSYCEAPPPPAGDALRGPPIPQDVLRGDGGGDVLRGPVAGEVVVGPAYPAPSRPNAGPP